LSHEKQRITRQNHPSCLRALAQLGLGLFLLGASFAHRTAAAQEPEWGLTLAAGLGGAAAPPSGQGHGVGRLLIDLGRGGLSFGGREGVASSELRTVGAIFIGGHLRLGEAGGYTRGGFAHHHETPWATFKQGPLQSLLGVSEGITHRSGLELGGGLRRPVASERLGGWLGYLLDGSVSWLPDAGGPRAYISLEALVTIRLATPQTGDPSSKSTK
jgi:hypothetical protein